MAHIGIRGALAAGVSVPDELAVVGFDDIPDAATAVVPLTTMRQDIPQRCRCAFYLLHQMIEDKGVWDVAQEVIIDEVG